MTPSKVPNIDPRPRERSIRKKVTAQNGEKGNSTIAWVNTTKAKPVPSAASDMI